MLPESLGFAVVDEVDSILIDESRNPMIISQPRGDNGGLVATVDKARAARAAGGVRRWRRRCSACCCPVSAPPHCPSLFVCVCVCLYPLVVCCAVGRAESERKRRLV